MSGFNTEVKKRTTELTTGIHLVSIIDAGIVKGPDGKPKVTESGEIGIMITFADGKNHIFQQIYYTKGEREYFFKKMCASANIDLDEVAKTGKFKAEARGKRVWIYIKEVWDIDGVDVVKHDVTGQPIITYYVFETSFVGNVDNRPAMKGDPAKNNGTPSDKFIEYRQIYKTPPTLEEKAHAAISEDNDDFPDVHFDAVTPKIDPNIVEKPIIYGTAGGMKGNQAFHDHWKKSEAMQPNNDFAEQKQEAAKHFEEEPIDFDSL